MYYIKFSLIYIFSWVIVPIYSIFLNIFYILKNIRNFKLLSEYRKACKKDLKDPMSIFKEVKKYVWTADTIEWRPWKITAILRNYHDDCDGLAVLSKDILSKSDAYTNIRLVGIYEPSLQGHMVTIAESPGGNILMISNDNIAHFSREDWKEVICKWGWHGCHNYTFVVEEPKIFWKNKL